ncbi:phytanoyl-CoA dioxygenase family protein [Amylibacter sp.]|nr:phytanoyl-CoA dioxygenase family protein [Amylibacter sp.]MDA8756341.1 phytanoyl-CoA dioxygenase family protein [Amylibacter sp.]MDA9586242.1 phytanoyl-CoA dioxygenase family protein [Amylibacter sp.]
MILSQNQKKQFWTDGFLLVENAINDMQLENLKKTFLDWVNDSRNYKTDYGETMDGRPRFDLQPGHSSDVPGLRRIQSPEEISEVFADVMRNGRSVDMCAELIGQGIRFHHGKVNSKLPGTATKVNFHQDFPFEPMTNDDMITCLLFIDDVTLENGPLEVVPGTHKGPLYSHWHNGTFTGSVSDEILAEHEDKIIRCTGKAGSVCLMHASLLHGSAPNLSNKSRTLYISTYYAEDAVELSPNHLPSTLTHELVRGEASGRVRCSTYDMQLPEVPKGTSFFAQQASAEK